MTGFDEDAFVRDLTSATAAVGAPVVPETAAAAFSAFPGHFRDGTVLWRTTDRPGDPLSYRLFPTSHIDTTAVAVDRGLVPADHPLLPLAWAWAELYDGATLHSCSFDSDFGLTKTWFYFGHRRPAGEILTAPGVPRGLAAREGGYVAEDLRLISFAAVDWRLGTVVLDFDVPGGLTRPDLDRYVDMAGSEPVPDETADVVVKNISRDYCVALAVDPADGSGFDAGFSVLDFPADSLPALPERIAAFFGDIPVHAADAFTVLGWSFGQKGRYMKAERQYRGDIRTVLTEWKKATGDA
ncbi:aromatic prenyltransferase [Actinokineospora sp. 24-640]